MFPLKSVTIKSSAFFVCIRVFSENISWHGKAFMMLKQNVIGLRITYEVVQQNVIAPSKTYEVV